MQTHSWVVLMRIVILDSEERRQRLLNIIAKVGLDPALQVTIETYDPKRSLQANRRYWMLVSEIAKETGHDKDEIHDYLKQKYLGTREIMIAGERANISPSSKRLKKKEFHEYMEKCENWAIESLGVWLE